MDENKKELFAYLGSHSLNISSDLGTVVTTFGEDAFSNKPDFAMTKVSPTSHEKADTRLILHVTAAINLGKDQILVKTVDSGVLVLCVVLLHSTPMSNSVSSLEQEKIATLSQPSIAQKLGTQKLAALLGFHAFTGCDTVSAFAARGKRTAWNTWNCYTEVTTALLVLSRPCTDITHEEFKHLERFTILMYDRASSLTNVNAARRHICLSPTMACLISCSRSMLSQCIMCWWYCFHGATILREEMSSGSIDITETACSVVHMYREAFEMFKVFMSSVCGGS